MANPGKRTKPVKPARERGLSELEGTVLGHLWKHGPTTAYAVRRAFLDSPSSHWSGSAGAVYPVLERLERVGVVRSESAPRGGRDASHYSLTSRGRARFLAWIEPPFAADVISVPPDPLRTRAHFFSAIPPARRARFFTIAIAGLRRHLVELDPTAIDDEDDRRALAGAKAVVRARIAWLEAMRRAIAAKGRHRPK